MGYNQAKMLEDINGDLIPQWYDPVEKVFKPLTNEPQDMRLTGSIREKLIAQDFLVTSGSSLRTPSFRHDSRKIVAVIWRRIDGFLSTGNFRVSLLERTADGSNEVGTSADRYFENASSSKHIMQPIEARTPNIQAEISNTSSEDAQFYVYLYIIS